MATTLLSLRALQENRMKFLLDFLECAARAKITSSTTYVFLKRADRVISHIFFCQNEQLSD